MYNYLVYKILLDEANQCVSSTIVRIETMVDVNAVLKSFEKPDETRHFTLGRFDIVRIGDMTLGRATYQPGWKWSVHVGPGLNQKLCPVEHIGLVISGAAVAVFEDGTVLELNAGRLFYIPPVSHDSWVMGTEPYVSLHFAGTEHYARS